ncbi:MAG: hypothetical protein K6U14_06370 [Firmicutes bacterium]|nr:hypothetical protein [Alicyclobacillaceae bacterium]MCL6497244.1 hypothetical protein [Bacillota bacterium]
MSSQDASLAGHPPGWVWTLAFFLYLGVGLVLIYHFHYFAADALSRVANAYYVLFSRDPHLGAIGFIWNPLPSLLALPMTILHPWVPDVVSRGVAGVVVSAAFGALGLRALYDLVGRLGLPPALRWGATALYALNPLVVLYGANGMTDLMLATCDLGAVNGVMGYVTTRELRYVIRAALWLMVGFGVRYEAIPLTVGLMAGLAGALWGRVPARQVQGALILLAAPIGWAAGVWIYFNWAIMKNPLYFLKSDYGNLAQIATGAYGSHPLAAAKHSLLGTLSYLGHFTLLFWPLLPALVVALALSFGRWRDPRAPVLVGATVGAVGLEAAFLYLGHLGQWDRYFLPNIPNGLLLTAFAAGQLRTRLPSRRGWRSALGVAFLLAVLSADVGTVKTLETPGWGYPDGAVLAQLARGEVGTQDPFTSVTPVVQWVNRHPHVTILADTFTDWPVVIRADHPRQFIVTSDYAFRAILQNPRGRVDAILVPKPTGIAALNAVNRQWPGLWAGQEPWATLIRAFPGSSGWRLYTVGPNAP